MVLYKNGKDKHEKGIRYIVNCNNFIAWGLLLFYKSK